MTMTLPKLGHGYLAVRKRQHNLSLFKLVMIIAAAAVFFSLGIIVFPTFTIVQKQLDNSKSLAGGARSSTSTAADKKRIKVEELELEHESRFHATIKNCLPAENSNKCRTFVPDALPGGTKSVKVQRIAVLAPPGDISSPILNRVEQIKEELLHSRQRESNNQGDNDELLDMEVIFRSSVPPYGYGKTHGLTKIVRLEPQPLLLVVTDTLQSVLSPPDETYASITLSDLKAAMRQILRFHCRLSHVAAHTAILSIPFMELVTSPQTVTTRLQNFLLDPTSNNDGNGVEKGEEADPNHQQEQQGNQLSLLLDAQERYGSQLLSNIEAVYHVDVKKVMDDVLLEELQKTKNFTAWPCLSFWGAGDEPDPFQISDIVQRIAKALSPNCNDPLATCFVDRDKCESQGDGLCQKKKG